MNIDLTLSPETEALLSALRAVPLGGEISYIDLSAKIGRSVTANARASLNSARRIALRDHGINFTAIRGVGLRRTRPEETPQIGAVARGSIRRKAKAARKAILSVTKASNGADPETQRRINAEMSALGLLSEISAQPAQKAFDSVGPSMPPAMASAAFMKHIGAVVTPVSGEDRE